MGKLKELLKEWWNKVFNKDKAAWLAVDKDGQEVLIFSKSKPHRMPTGWWTPYDKDSILEFDLIYVRDGFIEEHLGRKLIWEDEPVEITQ